MSTYESWNFTGNVSTPSSGRSTITGGYYPYTCLVALPTGYDQNRATPYKWLFELHGARADATMYDPTFYSGGNGIPVVAKYLSLGYVVVVPYQSGPALWGNAACLSAVRNCWTWAKGHYNVEAKAVLGGQSMGGAVMANLFARYPSDWWAVACCHPAVNFYDMYNGANGSTNYSADLNADYGSWAGTNGYRPEDFYSDFASAAIPVKFWHGTADTVVATHNSTSFRDGVNAIRPGLVQYEAVAGGSHYSGTVDAYVADVETFLTSIAPAFSAAAVFDHIALTWPDTATGEDGWYVERRISG